MCEFYVQGSWDTAVTEAYMCKFEQLMLMAEFNT